MKGLLCLKESMLIKSKIQADVLFPIIISLL